MATYYTLLTNYGTQQFAKAVANNQPLTVTHFAVGDGNGKTITPNATRTTLFKEVYRAAASRISLDPKNDKQIIFELTIPENVGGFTIREMGLFDSSGKMLAHANCPANYKPQLSEGTGKLQVLRMVLKISHKDAVTLTIDNSTIWATVGQATPKTITATSKNQLASDGHTHEIDLASLTIKGLVQLTNDTGLDSESLALTAKAGKALAQAIAKVQQMAAGKWTRTDATTSQKGIAQLNSATNSNAENQAATPKAVKAAFDRASTAINNAQAAQTAANNAQATANSKQSPATTLVGYGITDFIHKNLTSENLNDIKQTGIYGQARDANATTARNYPEQIAGALLVHPSAYGFMQEYVTYSGYRRYIRNQNASGGWAAWQRIDFQLNNTLTSTNTTQALTAAQGKKLNDDKVNRSGDTIKGNLVLDKTEQNEWSALYLKSKGGDYRFEGNPVDSDNRLNIVHQVGRTQKYLRMRKFDNDEFFAYESWVKNGFVPIHNPSHTGTILGNYRLVIDRNEAAYTPYINLKDSSVDFAKAVTNEKAVSDINTYIKNGENERGLSTLRTMIKTDKNATGHYGVIGADGTMRWAWSAFGKTGNLAIGKTADDGTHKLQVAGSIHATGQTILNSPTAIVRFQNGGTNYGYVGFPASNSKNIRFSSNLWGNSYLELQESKIVAGQALYEGGNRVQHHGQRYAEVTTANGVLSGLSVNLNGAWFGRVESSDDKRWKFIHNGDRAYWLPRNTSNQDKTIATTDDVNTRLPLTGGTLTGVLAINNGSYSTLSQRNAANGHTRLEVLPDNNTNFYKISYWNASNAETNNALFPKSGIGEIVAYQDWVNSRLTWGNISGKPNLALKTDIAGAFTQSLNQNGWTKLPNGLILQWGRSTASGDVTFPLKFPNRCFNVVLIPNPDNVQTVNNPMLKGTPTQSAFGWYTHGGAGYISWQAIGY